MEEHLRSCPACAALLDEVSNAADRVRRMGRATIPMSQLKGGARTFAERAHLRPTVLDGGVAEAEYQDFEPVLGAGVSEGPAPISWEDEPIPEPEPEPEPVAEVLPEEPAPPPVYLEPAETLDVEAAPEPDPTPAAPWLPASELESIDLDLEGRRTVEEVMAAADVAPEVEVAPVEAEVFAAEAPLVEPQPEPVHLGAAPAPPEDQAQPIEPAAVGGPEADPVVDFPEPEMAHAEPEVVQAAPEVVHGEPEAPPVAETPAPEPEPMVLDETWGRAWEATPVRPLEILPAPLAQHPEPEQVEREPFQPPASDEVLLAVTRMRMELEPEEPGTWDAGPAPRRERQPRGPLVPQAVLDALTSTRALVGLGVVAAVLLAFLVARPFLHTTPKPVASGASQPAPSVSIAPTPKTQAPTPAASAPAAPVAELADVVSTGSGSAPYSVSRIRTGQPGGGIFRLVFDLAGGGAPPAVQVGRAADGTVVIRSDSLSMDPALASSFAPQGPITSMTLGPGQGMTLKLAMSRQVGYSMLYLPPSGAYSERLVIDFR